MATLSEMNEKQRVKEFKRIAKELKSKDVSVREGAIKIAFEEHAYLVEGKGLLSLLEGVAAKKKVLDLSCVSLEALHSSYLSMSPERSSEEESDAEAASSHPSPTRTLLNLVVDNNENLFLLQNISDLIHFKTEVKKKPGVPEDLEGMALEEKSRHLSAQVLAMLATDILSVPYAQSLCDFFNLIPSITESVCAALKIAYVSFQDEEKRESSLDNINNLLVCLALLVTYSNTSIEYLLASEVMIYMPELVKQTKLKLNSLRIYKAILKFTTDERISTDHLDAIVEVLDTTYPTVVDAFASAHVDPKAKGKPAKGAPPPEEHTDPSTTPSHLLSCLTLISEILIEYSKSNLIISEEYVDKIVISYDAVALLPNVWNILHEPQVVHDIKLSYFCHYICILLGTIATIGGSNLRTKVCQSGGVKILTSVLNQSSSIIGGVSEDGVVQGDAAKSLSCLRRLSEQGILFLTTSQKNKEGEMNQETEQSKEEPIGEEDGTGLRKGIDFTTRQMGDGAYETDVSLFEAADGEAEAMVPFTLITDLLSSEDQDVTARVVRAIGIIITNVPNPVAFVTRLNIAPSVVEILSKLVEMHSTAMLSPPQSSDAITADGQGEAATGPDTLDEVAADAVKQEQERKITMDEVLTPKTSEVLCWLFRIFDVLFRLSPENMNAYSTQENVSNLARLVFAFGPTGSDNELQEYIVDIFDVRSYTWDETDSRPLTNVVFRSYLLDVLTLVVASDVQFREYTTGTVPTAPNTALSESTLSTESSIQTVTKWILDAAVSVVLTDSTLDTSQSHQLKISPSEFSILNVAVLNSALSFLYAVSSNGVFGLEHAIESVALPQIEDSQKASIYVFKGRLARAMPELVEKLPLIKENELYISSPEVLKPMHFDSVLAEVVGNAGEEQEEGDVNPVIHPASALMMTAENLSKTQKLWPFIILSSALMGILNRPDYTAETAEIAFNSVCGFCKSPQFADENQPAINDIFSAVFISLGGGVTLSAISGKFGCLKDRQANIDFLDFLFRRGTCRESFWAEFAEGHATDEAAAPPSKGKAPPSKKGGAPEPTPGYPVSPDEHHQDPSHGPTMEVWSYLVSQVHDDLHTHSTQSTASIVSIQGMLTHTALALIECGADVNIGDYRGITPLMYALLLGNASVVDSLIAAGANVDAIDSDSNPVIKYALLSVPEESMTKEDIPSTFCTNAPSTFDISDANCRSFKAEAILLDKVITAGVDLKVCDSDGNFPLQIACSFGFLYISVGGYLVELRSKFYSTHKLDSSGSYEISPVQEMCMLIENGASVNSCNRSGITPLHICAAFSDIDAMNLLIASNAEINSLDLYGFLPLHYCISCCHENAMRAIKLLLEVGVGRVISMTEFTDKRSGKSTQEKKVIDLETSLAEIFIGSIDPLSIRSKRTSKVEDLLLMRTVEGANILQLVLSAENLIYDNMGLFLTSESPTRKSRETVLEYIFNQLPVTSNKDFYLNIDVMETTVLHAATLFFIGDSEIQEVCPKRRINPIYYGNLELQLLDHIFFHDPAFDVNTLCTRPIAKLSGISSQSGWFPVAGAISSNNVAFVKVLVEHGLDLNTCNANDFIQQYLSDETTPVGIKGLLSMRAGETIEVTATVHDVAVQEVAKLELSRPRSRDSMSR